MALNLSAIGYGRYFSLFDAEAVGFAVWAGERGFERERFDGYDFVVFRGRAGDAALRAIKNDGVDLRPQELDVLL